MYENKFVVLQRNHNKTHGGQWGLPAGKVDEGEEEVEAVVREVFEETGINLNQSDLSFVEKLNVRNNGHDLTFSIFSVNMVIRPSVSLEPKEHQGYKWVTAEKSMAMDYVHDLDVCNEVMFGK